MGFHHTNFQLLCPSIFNLGSRVGHTYGQTGNDINALCFHPVGWGIIKNEEYLVQNTATTILGFCLTSLFFLK